ncbi:MAG: hypothetical protein ACFFB0_13485 [Promethearchaeota archaeon]
MIRNALKIVNKKYGVIKIENQIVLKTWEEICLDKLKEIGVSTAAEWAAAMGYGHNRNGVVHVINRIKRKMPEKLEIYYNKRPRLYKAI